MNKDAGRGGPLLIPVRLESGAEVPFLVDTGSPMMLLDQSLEPQLGPCLGTAEISNFGTKYETRRYAAPRLYLGNARLIADSNAFTCDFVKKMSAGHGRPLRGILGMDSLRHYCLQLDFRAGKMRFLDPNHLRPAQLGQAFPLTFAHVAGEPPEWVHPCISHSSLAGGPDGPLLIDTGADYDGLLEPGLFRREVRAQRLRSPPDPTPGREPDSVERPQCVWNGLTYTGLWLGNGRSVAEPNSGENALGLRFLARHLVTFDFPHRTLYLKQISRGPLVKAEVIAAARKTGDSAYSFAKKCRKNGQLPGWSPADRGTIKKLFHVRFDPDTVTLDAVKKGDTSTYHYEFSRASKDAPWQLRQAWRTDQDDRLVEEYPIP